MQEKYGDYEEGRVILMTTMGHYLRGLVGILIDDCILIPVTCD